MNTEVANSRPHPILDDSSRMMRIIVNPTYDRLTISRAAHMRKVNPLSYDCKLIRLNRRKEKNMNTSVKSSSNEQTITMSNTDKVQPKTTLGSSTRYVNSRYGFEIRRYSSPNWLSIDLLTKDACQKQEKTFREMLDKQEQNEIVAQNVYSLEYYRQRYKELLQSYQQGPLTREQWAKQNYQLHCIRTLYTQAYQREQYLLGLHAEQLRQNRAQTVFKKWKDVKDQQKHAKFDERPKTTSSQRTTESPSVSSNPSFCHSTPTANATSSSLTSTAELEQLSIFRPVSSVKDSLKTLYMLDKRRSSLQAMLKRIVGLDGPLPPPPKIPYRQPSSRTNAIEDSEFDSNFSK
ncbi:unnamed protein product [Adineta ricciae]|uniref:Uncharacterized protein n=1 Tax=Adineta ricciae TaxID=249248 RepID=A0A813YTF3_ADIRI|nr:unnamed protein product [Adineta ricciae]CAF1529620.1 unnamed protein product [Adineta ricciae]